MNTLKTPRIEFRLQ